MQTVVDPAPPGLSFESLREVLSMARRSCQALACRAPTWSKLSKTRLDGWCTLVIMITPVSDASRLSRTMIPDAEAASSPLVGSSVESAHNIEFRVTGFVYIVAICCDKHVYAQNFDQGEMMPIGGASTNMLG